jgi:gas vesicle structural protein
MTAVRQTPNRYLERPAPSSLADVIDVILDKGLVIDIYVRVSLVGIELLTIDARIVIASIDTYLRFAEAVNRLDLTETQTHGIPELMEDLNSSGAKGKTEGAIEAVQEKVEGLFSQDDEDEDQDNYEDEDRSSRSDRRRPRPAKKSTANRPRVSSGDRQSPESQRQAWRSTCMEWQRPRRHCCGICAVGRKLPCGSLSTVILPRS